ncbi:hypothetical protein QYE76_009329 [Lolium multiflorum]|uniref:CCHC-type domain-containing protein n=1 Tax=Lolium multiflorum TaxID=4521 RepID=A0AAD8TTF6_LOLMU|nr:hypothetical protein QYE76_009329 [Lolium multiflorum]
MRKLPLQQKKRYDMMRNEVNVRPKPCAVPRLTVCLQQAKLMGRGAYTRMAPPTRNNFRARANQVHSKHAKMTDTISILAMERKALRHQHAKKDYLIARLRVKIASLEQLIPIPHHAPRGKSNVTCYECGVTGHYSNKVPGESRQQCPKDWKQCCTHCPKDKSTVTCYECGTVGHYSNECPKKLAKIAANTAAPAQQQRRITTRRKLAPNYPNNRNGRYYNMKATEAQEAPQNMPRITLESTKVNPNGEKSNKGIIPFSLTYT